MSALTIIKRIADHPLNRSRKVAAMARFVKWQIGSRLLSEDIVFEWIAGTKLFARNGETGVTGNIYCGLYEFADMAFLLHLLRKGDLFADIGANVGAYTILASGATGAKSIAFEPVPATYDRLLANIRLNSLEALVRPMNRAIGDRVADIQFSSTQNCTNHVLSEGESTSAPISVPMTPLDETVEEVPLLIKLDVEGYETPALAGAGATLADERVRAVIIELNGSGVRYGYDDETVIKMMIGHGFDPVAYDPFKRALTKIDGRNPQDGNTIFARDTAFLKKRIESAPPFAVHGLVI